MFDHLIINLFGPKMNEYHKELIATNHYLKTWRSLKEQYVFELLDEGQIVGMAVFGQPCGTNVTRKYGDNTLELRRFYVLDHMPKNTASYFLSRCLKQLRKTGMSKVISYSDPNQGHTGVMYRATNFEYLGKELSPNPRVIVYKNKKIPMRMYYAKVKDKSSYQPFALKYQALVKSGEAKI